MPSNPIDQRNKVKRVPKRGQYDEASIFEILDAGFMCHIGFVMEGQPFVIPTSYGREGNKLYFHGSTKSRMLLHAEQGFPVCLTVTHLDGLVLARSAYHHSMNYRSVVIFGTARKVEPEKKEAVLKVISDQILPGRWEEVRKPSEQELKATTVLELTIEQASAKIRTGPPVDEPEDYALPIWAGVLPIETTFREPMSDPELPAGIPFPKSVPR